jgi:O-antigen ligase
MLPLAFAAPFRFTPVQWKTIGIVFTGLVTAGTAWSLLHYSADMTAVEQGYLRSKSIITPLKDDHVRFSWMVSLAALLAGWLGYRDLQKRSRWAWLYFLTSAWLIVFLHVLAARTGLLSFYMILAGLLIGSVYARWKPRYSLLFLFLLISLPVAAYFLLPTLRNRVTYFKYDLGYFKDTHYLPGGNDAVRVISLKAGWEIMNAHKFTGVGFGDINDKTLEWYHINYPGMN